MLVEGEEGTEENTLSCIYMFCQQKEITKLMYTHTHTDGGAGERGADMPAGVGFGKGGVVWWELSCRELLSGAAPNEGA